MVSSIVLITCERGMVNQAGEALANIDGISEVYSVAGKVDLVAIVRVASNDALADVITNKLQNITGITDTETLISFRVFSKHDLESMFSIGMES
jgi:DNA-binding Lrp family transcriptional regulator